MPDMVSTLLGVIDGYNADPSSWAPLYAAASKQYNVPLPLLHALTGVESGGRVSATSDKGAGGAQQLMPDTAEGLGVTNLRAPTQSIPAAAAYLRQGFDKYGNWQDALKYYFAGPNEALWKTKTAAYPGKIAAKLVAAGVDPKEFGLTAPGQAGQVGQVVIHNPLGSGTGPQGTAPADIPAMLLRTIDGAPDAAAELAKIKALPQVTPTGAPVKPQEQPAAAALSAAVVPGQEPNPSQGAAPNPPVSPTGQAVTAAPAVAPWGVNQELTNAVTLGASPYLAAGLSGAIAGIGGLFDPTAPSMGQAASRTLEAQLAGRRAWEQAHPLGTLALQTLGAGGATGAGLKLAGAAAGAGGRALAEAVPAVAPAVAGATKLLSGAAGVGTPGAAGFLARRAGDIASGATTGALAGAMQTGLGDQSIGQNLQGGAMLGGVAGAALNPLLRMGANAVLPTVNPGVARLTQTPLGQELGLRPGQVAQSKLFKTLDGMLNSHDNDRQLEAVSRLLARTIGSDAPRLDGSAFADALKRIGAGMDAFAERNPIKLDRRLFQDLDDVKKLLASKTDLDDSEVRRISKTIDMVEQSAMRAAMTNNNFIPGKTYTGLTDFNSSITGIQGDKNPRVSLFGSAMRRALNNALERSAPADEVQGFQQLRRQYRYAKIIQPLVEKNASTGIIDPTQLSNTVRRQFSDYAGNTTDPLVQIAKLGQLLSKPTVQGDVTKAFSIRASLRDILHASGILGVYELATSGHPGLAGGALIGAPIAYGLAQGLKKITASPRYTNALANMALGGTRPAPTINPLLPYLNSARVNNPNFVGP